MLGLRERSGSGSGRGLGRRAETGQHVQAAGPGRRGTVVDLVLADGTDFGRRSDREALQAVGLSARGKAGGGNAKAAVGRGKVAVGHLSETASVHALVENNFPDRRRQKTQ